MFGESALIFGGLMLAVLMRWVATPLLLVLLIQSLLHLPRVLAPFVAA